MAISLGDAVLIFKGDQSDLDAAFASVPDKAQKSFGAATQSVQSFNDELDATGENVTLAGEKIMSLTQAFRTLGVQGPDLLKQKLDNAKIAFATLQEAGVNASGTLLQATIKVTEKEIAYQQALGNSTAALRAQMAALQGQFTQLSGPAGALGTDLEQAAEKGTNAFHETRGSLTLLAEQMGIHLPREIKSFLAGIEGIQGVLAGAFSAIAIIALIDVLVKVTEKVTEWISETFILTEAQKILNTVLLDSNQAIVDYAKQIDELNRKEELLGKTASELASVKVRFAIEDADKVSAQVRDMQNELYGLRNELVSIPDAISVVNKKLQELHQGASAEDLKKLLLPEDADMQQVVAALSGLHDQLLAEQKKFDKDVEIAQNEQGLVLTQQQNAFDQAQVNASKTMHAARLDAQHEAARLALLTAHASVSDLLLEQKRYEDQRYQIALQGEQQALAILQRDPTKNVDQIITANAKIQALEVEHQAQLSKALADGIQKRRELTNKILEDWQKLQEQNVAKTFEATAKAAQELTIEENKLHEAQTKLEEARVGINMQKQLQDIEDLATAGVLNEKQAFDQTKQLYLDEEAQQLSHLNVLKQQQQKSIDDLQAQIASAKNNPFFTDAQLLDLQKNLDKAEVAIIQTQQKIETSQAAAESKIGNLDRTFLKQATSSWNAYFSALLSGSLKTGQVIQGAFKLMGEAIGSAVTQAIMGSKGFGDAMESMLKSTLASISGMAVAHAAEQIGFAFEDLATPFFEYHASTHFLSAAKWAGLAAAAGVGAALIPSGSSSGSGSSSPSAPTNLPPTAATSANPNPPPLPTIATVLHMAGGGLVSGPTLAIVGDSMRSSAHGASEAVIPLDNPRAMQQIAEAMVEYMPGNQSVTHIHIKGDVIDHNGLMRTMTRQINRGSARLSSSNALRLTRRA
jgi:hypothetical protein